MAGARAAFELRLQHLGVLEVLVERRLDADERALELGVQRDVEVRRWLQRWWLPLLLECELLLLECELPLEGGLEE